MSLNGNAKKPVAVPAVRVPVLGGMFHVTALLVAPDESRDNVLAVLEATPRDRWFVMVADNAGSEEDALAMIDDDLEFQIYARGVLHQD